MADYIPKKDEDFLLWAENFITRAQEQAETFKLDPAALSDLSEKLADFKAAYAKAKEPNRGKEDVFRKNETRDILKKAIRFFVRASIAHNPAISPFERIRLGLPATNYTRSPIQAPKTFPVITLDCSVIRQISVRFKDAESGRRAKPKGVSGILLRWAILDNPPRTVEELSGFALDTANPLHLDFSEADRFKTVYLCPCWVNGKGDQGPFGEIIKVIIP